jgi:hypothetical protein
MIDALRPRFLTAAILWPLGLVAAVHLLTTPGQWLFTDQKEYILVAERLVLKGSLHLAEPGEPPRKDLPWVASPRQDEPLRSRLLPLTSFALGPFVLADRALGSKHPTADRPFVHLQGHAFVLAALAVMALALADRGASASAIAAAVVLTGLAWPLWMVSRRGGAESVYVFLVALFVLGHARWSTDPGRPRGRALMAVACGLLPWGNPAGAVLGAALLAGALGEAWWTGRDWRGVAIPAITWAASSAALVLVWNHWYHGHWWLGGYATHLAAERTVVDTAALSRGVLLHLKAIAVEAGPLIAVAALGAFAGDRRDRAFLLIPVFLAAAMFVLFAAFPDPEPTRRFAPVWPAWGVAAGSTFARLRWGIEARQAALALAAVVGFHGFWITEGRYHAGPGGLFYPSVKWVRMWIDSAPAWQYALPCFALVALIIAAARQTSRLLAVDEPAGG